MFARQLRMLIIIMLLILPSEAVIAGGLHYQKSQNLSEVFPSADSFGEMEGTPLVATAYSDKKKIGYVFVTTNIISSIGYSGKPIKTLVGVDLDGYIVGATVIEHHEPILLAGIPQKKLDDFTDRHVGLNIYNSHQVTENKKKTPLDLISGATVTAMIINDTTMRAARKILASKENGGTIIKKDNFRLKDNAFENKSWTDLLGDGSVRRMTISDDEVKTAFSALVAADAELYDDGIYDENADFIDIYTALATPSIIGKNLIGDDEYNWMTNTRLKDGDQAILIAANGSYSFRGSAFVRGGIFDRIYIIQDENTFRFRDKHYKRLANFTIDGAPDLTEIGIFVIPKEEVDSNNFDPTKPWRLELLVGRHVSALDKIFTTFSLNYILPKKYIEKAPIIDTLINKAIVEIALWERIWDARYIDIIILSASIIFLIGLFFLKYSLKHARRMQYIHTAFLVFTVIWIGFYAKAQLSVVNVLTFVNSLLSGFRWETFLLEPLIFIIWSAVMVFLLFWGRGIYCGWLCPFGALQELLNKIARFFKIPQITVPFWLHERLLSVKYIIFLGLLALSLHSMAMAERFADIEPFKTVILLHFSREWQFVFYAIILLIIGIFIERFFCRYICPLGAALSIPTQNRLFRWLKRRKQCGTECHICAVDCGVQAISPEGEINASECMQCLKCQVNYNNNRKCPPLIARRLRKELKKAKKDEKKNAK